MQRIKRRKNETAQRSWAWSLTMVLGAAGAVQAQAVDTLENIGADGTPVTTRVLDGVTITLSNAGATPMTARTYGSTTDSAFGGAGNALNTVLDPSLVSGSRFISGAESGDNFNVDQALVFQLSEPVAAFGLTTLDLMESVGGADQLTLQAFDSMGNMVSEHVRNGDQDLSGLALLWRVASDTVGIREVRLVGSTTLNADGYGIDDIFLRKDPIAPFMIEVAQESAPGVGDFSANIVGMLLSTDYFLTPEQYYSWHSGGTSFTGPGLTSPSGSSFSVFRSASTGQRCLVLVHDRSEDGSGGSVNLDVQILGDTNGADFLVKDDEPAVDSNDSYTVSPDGLQLNMTTSWSPCCTDGAVVGSLEGDWGAYLEFNTVPTGVLSWFGLSRGTTPLPVVLEVGRRVRLRSLEGEPPVGSGDCFADGTGTACPCGNDTTPGEGCGNSTGSGAVIQGTGSPSVSADDLMVRSIGVIPNQFGVIFVGPGSVEASFGDGLRCVGAGQVFRYPIQNSGPTAMFIEGPGLAAYSLANFPPAGQLTAGSTFRFQCWYRDPGGPCSSGFNLSNALEVVFGP